MFHILPVFPSIYGHFYISHAFFFILFYWLLFGAKQNRVKKEAEKDFNLMRIEFYI